MELKKSLSTNRQSPILWKGANFDEMWASYSRYYIDVVLPGLDCAEEGKAPVPEWMRASLLVSLESLSVKQLVAMANGLGYDTATVDHSRPALLAALKDALSA